MVLIMASKRTLEERIRDKDERMQKALEKAKQYEAQKKQLEQRQKAEDRKARAHRLIQIGAAAENVLGREFVEGDIERFMNFLKLQERNGSFYTKALQKPAPSSSTAKAKVRETATIDVIQDAAAAPDENNAIATGEDAEQLYYIPTGQQ